MRDEEVVRRFDLLELSPGDYWIVAKCGLLIMTFAYIMAGVIAANTGVESWLFVFTPPAVGVVYSAWMIWAANRRLSPIQRVRLREQRDLTIRLEALQTSSGTLAGDSATTQARIGKLLDLALRMKRLDAGYMAERISEIEWVIESLRRELRANDLLMAGYDFECQLLLVEIDALDIVPKYSGAGLHRKALELSALEQLAHNRRRLHAADMEVAILLAEAGDTMQVIESP